MKSIITVALMSFWSLTVTAQSIERQVIGATGSYNEQSWGSLSATTGETVTETGISGNLIITQGFQQPLLSDTTMRVADIFPDDIQIYPNPTGGHLYISTTYSIDGIKVFDGKGRLVIDNNSSGRSLDMGHLERGVYLVRVIMDNRVYHARIIRQ